MRIRDFLALAKRNPGLAVGVFVRLPMKYRSVLLLAVVVGGGMVLAFHGLSPNGCALDVKDCPYMPM
ncbi:hypothetical protein ABH20_18190 [Geobacillus sp. T6]|nr:hypothetical protein ABH20_18190 [Geobacillus sp. T6]